MQHNEKRSAERRFFCVYYKTLKINVQEVLLVLLQIFFHTVLGLN